RASTTTTSGADPSRAERSSMTLTGIDPMRITRPICLRNASSSLTMSATSWAICGQRVVTVELLHEPDGVREHAGRRRSGAAVREAENRRDDPVDVVARAVVREESDEIRDAQSSGAAVGFAVGVVLRVVQRNREDARALPWVGAALDAVAAPVRAAFPV